MREVDFHMYQWSWMGCGDYPTIPTSPIRSFLAEAATFFDFSVQYNEYQSLPGMVERTGRTDTKIFKIFQRYLLDFKAKTYEEI